MSDSVRGVTGSGDVVECRAGVCSASLALSPSLSDGRFVGRSIAGSCAGNNNGGLASLGGAGTDSHSSSLSSESVVPIEAAALGLGAEQ